MIFETLHRRKYRNAHAQTHNCSRSTIPQLLINLCTFKVLCVILTIKTKIKKKNIETTKNCNRNYEILHKDFLHMETFPLSLFPWSLYHPERIPNNLLIVEICLSKCWNECFSDGLIPLSRSFQHNTWAM